MASEETILPINIEDEMRSSFLDYAMSVIVSRALPDARDGLKPVHRRILYAMHELGLSSNKAHKKSARIVGEVLGKYHPHGDVAVYDSMVRMAQDFSYMYPLVDGQGNFGSVDGDSAAAMRYTEARLSKIAEAMLSDIEKDTVDFAPNFDETLKEPVVLPSKVPNLLINGSSGIAVGMATNIPPHNLGEVVDGIIMAIDNPDVTLDEMMTVVRGPDFPTGAYIVGRAGIRSAYSTGRGIVKLRARASIEKREGGRECIIITEIPYQVNKAKLVEGIAELVREKKIDNIADLRDESDRSGMRIVVELRLGANADVVLNSLYKHTQMENSFGVNTLALVDGQPKELTLRDLIFCYIDHRKEVVTRRTQYELKKAEARAHILEGLKVALSNIDEVVKLIRGSKTTDEARINLIEKFLLSKEQAQAILDMKLSTLAALEREKIDEEHSRLIERIIWLKNVLASEGKLLGIIKEELMEIKEKFSDERRTVIIDDTGALSTEDLIADEPMAITITNDGYVKRLHIDTFKQQRRGGRGIIGAETKEEDFITDLFIASTHNYMLFFTNKGKVYWLKVYDIPSGGRYSKGKAIVNLLSLGEGESVTTAIPISKFDDDHYLVFATKRGISKKTALSAYSNPRAGGIIALVLVEGDELVDVKLTDGEQEIILSTKHGKAIRFKEGDVRYMGRAARGVKGISLRKDDEVIGMDIVMEGAVLLTITENGYGKRTPISQYRTQRRGGQGIINIKTSLRNGLVVGIKEVSEEDELMVTSSEGIVIREPVKEIRLQGRNTQGVRLMRLKENDKVVSVARIVKQEEV
ncbi:MAG: DNA gyrase subunit A [Halobacteriota archaeon]|nr:DNA gyrase subunit A [Halobacteriota archaeon]